ncbi:PREDICTED: uncharacterized protein LOC108373261 [Rhagoletis zephyria]|uniref:uncharacterized protein LOC108373261 n=1 Tax=Rhagoletis zephyria TaxID=28612 RepID=UPI0008119265|nr:PREDICTED: uncharacterized protein LOC108373261 [Rhagoletis zephyria]
MNSTDEQCSRRWLALRERYARETRRLNAPSGSGASAEKVWPLMDSLQFLKKHIIPRRCRTSKNLIDSLPPSPQDLNPSPSILEQSAQHLSSSPLCLPESPLLVEVSSSPIPVPELCQSDLSPSPSGSMSATRKRVKKRGNEDDMDKLFYEAVEMFKQACTTPEAAGENDVVDNFTKMMQASIKQMSATKQTIAMERITAVVMALQRETEP